MTHGHTVVDPYPGARLAIVECCERMIEARKLFDAPELTAEQKKEFAEMVLERAQQLHDAAQKVLG